MSKLHEFLAVESSLEKISRKLILECFKTFKDKQNLFKGFTKRLEMFNEEDQNLNETTSLELESTVGEKLKYIMPEISKHWDTVLVKDLANQMAMGDIELSDGTVLAKDLPAVFLLGLESKLGELRKLYEAIPTLAPGIKWEPDDLERKGVYTNGLDEISFRTETKTEFIEASPATKEHPAQVVSVKNVKNTGKYSTSSQSGMISSLKKSEMLSRFDELFIAVKKARMRANTIEIDHKTKTSSKLLSYINGD